MVIRNRTRWIPRPWKDRVRIFSHLNDFEREKQAAYDRIDFDGFGYWTVFTAGAGFLTGAYDIFAVNMIVPMVSIVYWNGKIPPSEELSINMATLVGTLIGQVAFGILGDRLGRKKMYGPLLILIIVATVCLALISKGTASSINILPWIISWRLLMGIGIGGDYPLSAVITSEFAPKRHRARMLATVFFAQPIGQLVACIIAVIATALLRHNISGEASPTNCVGECLRATDKIWRWIVGFGAIPPAFAVLLRFYIPESPRYLLEVERNPMGIDAADYPRNKYHTDPLLDEEDGDDDASTGSADQETTNADGPDENRFGHSPQSEGIPPAPSGSLAPSQSTAADQLEETEIVQLPAIRRPVAPRDALFKQHELQVTNHRLTPDSGSIKNAPVPSSPPQRASPHIQDSETSNHQGQVQQPGKESWKEFWRGFRVYLFTDKEWTAKRLWLILRFKDEHFFDGSWTDLAGTASTWLLLDFSFYMLTVNSPKLISKIWDAPEYTVIYPMLIQYSWRAMISTSIGAVIGGATFIAMARYRWNLQLYGFIILAGLFVIVGTVFIKVLGGRYFASIIVLYSLCNLFFDFGPNTSTFIIPAEVFPTKYRASCHGISAGAGKLGSIITQIFLAKAKFRGQGVNDSQSHWLGWVLLTQSGVMLLGALITKAWVPNPCDIHGNSRSLEDLGRGKQARQAMEKAEKAEEKAREQPNGARRLEDHNVQGEGKEDDVPPTCPPSDESKGEQQSQ